MREIPRGGGTPVTHALRDLEAPTVAVSASLDVALDTLTSGSPRWVSVLDHERGVVGVIVPSDVVRRYRTELLVSLHHMEVSDTGTEVDSILIDEGSPLAGVPLRTEWSCLR